MKRVSNTLSILMVGDLCISQSKPSSILGNTVPLLQNADITIANLEGPICDESLQPLPGKIEAGSGAHLRMRPGIEKELKEVGIDAVAIANNHCMDFQEDGMLQTIDLLKRANMPYAGGGRNKEDAHRHCILEQKGFRVALLSYTSCYVPISFPAGDNKPGCAVISCSTAYEAPYNIHYQPGSIPRIITWAQEDDKTRMIEDVRKAKEQADIVVVSFHWGQTARGNSRSMRIPLELSTCFVVDYQEELGRAAVDAGADIIWGHHPHELQGIEIYKGKLICYSLGNFVFDVKKGLLNMRPVERYSIIVKCTMEGNKKFLYSFIPVQLNPQNMGPEALDLKKGKHILDLIAVHSQKYRTSFKKDRDEVLIIGPQE